ncbi:MAG: DUF6314 family protein [Paracoccaceae bacterium]|nr:DUF6314 family protein [Paracoccaceae bacterium]
MGPKLADFLGDWRLEREIVQGDGMTARFIGRAQFRPEGAGLQYHETGHLQLSGLKPMLAERRYLWRQDGARICVDYPDGRAFHCFDPADPQATHWCDPDDYRVLYGFDTWPDWQARWRVRGPRKDYTMLSTYRPA